MTKPMTILVGVAVAFAALVILFVVMTGAGREAVTAIARDSGVCESATSCVDGVELIYSIAEKDYGAPRLLIDWCLGTEEWAAAADVKVRRGGWVKDVAVWVMYLPCGSMLQDEAPSQQEP